MNKIIDENLLLADELGIIPCDEDDLNEIVGVYGVESESDRDEQ